MTSQTSPILQSRSSSRQGRRAKSTGDSEEPERKPKKVNSEVRKQQNRIASRNYREKRKRKLQYLQQLVKDSPDNPHESEPTSDQYDAYERSVSVDHEDLLPDSSPFLLPSNDMTEAMSARHQSPCNMMPSVHAQRVNNHVSAAAQAYNSAAMGWNTAIYSAPSPPPPPPPNMNWNLGPWSSGIETHSNSMQTSQNYGYLSVADSQPFHQTHVLPQQAQVSLPSPDFYSFGIPLYGTQGQTIHNPNHRLNDDMFDVHHTAWV